MVVQNQLILIYHSLILFTSPNWELNQPIVEFLVINQETELSWQKLQTRVAHIHKQWNNRIRELDLFDTDMMDWFYKQKVPKVAINASDTTTITMQSFTVQSLLVQVFLIVPRQLRHISLLKAAHNLATREYSGAALFVWSHPSANEHLV